MESVWSWVDIQLVHAERSAKKLVALPTFKSFEIFNKELVEVQKLKPSVTLDKTFYAGFVILELSKLHKDKFHYGYIKSTYGDKDHLLLTDTDSLCYHIEIPDVYKVMARRLDLFKASYYPQAHEIYRMDNKKKTGYFKDELNSKPIYEFVGLRAKTYSLLSSEDEKKIAKSVAKKKRN